MMLQLKSYSAQLSHGLIAIYLWLTSQMPGTCRSALDLEQTVAFGSCLRVLHWTFRSKALAPPLEASLGQLQRCIDNPASAYVLHAQLQIPHMQSL